MKKLILTPPTLDDVIRLFAAWRFWLLGALTGGVIAAGLYWVSPPLYRARATVLVDQNVEQAIPEETSDLRRYTYLQRETDKLKDIAWSDQTLARVTTESGLSLQQLRDKYLRLSQPADGSWHFFADGADPAIAGNLASEWAAAFTAEVQSRPEGISPLVEVNFTQQEGLPITRMASAGLYVFAGALVGIGLVGLGLLFLSRKPG